MGYVARGIAVPLVGEASDLTTNQIGLVMSAYSLVFILSQVPVGALAERIRHRPLLVGCALVGALGFGGLFLSAATWQMGLAMGVLGLTLGTIFVQSAAWAAKLAPAERRSLYLASFDAVIDLSFLVTPLAVGPLTSRGVRLPFLLSAFLLLASAGTLSRIPEGQQP
jgi:MFS family permease